MTSSLELINQRRIKTKIYQTDSTASPLKMLRDHMMAITQQQYQPPLMYSLGQINQRTIKTKIQTPITASPLKMLRDHMMASTQHQYQLPIISEPGRINQPRLKTKIT